MTTAPPHLPISHGKVLAFHPGVHDGAACVFDGYDLVAAVQQERLTRIKGDGGGIPWQAIQEVLDIAGWKPTDIDAIALTRGAVPLRYLADPASPDLVRRAARGKTLFHIADHLAHRGHMDSQRVFRSALLRQELGVATTTPVHFANHHACHALAALFYTQWDEALVITHDGGGDLVHGSLRILRNGVLSCLHGDDTTSLAPKRIDSLALAYGFATAALGYRMNRHEGKLTGLAAYGQPTALERLSAPWGWDDLDLPLSDLPGNGTLRALVEDAAESCAKPADMAASVQTLLEKFWVESVRRLVAKTGITKLAVAGGVFANVRLNRALVEETGAEEIFIFPAMGDDGLPVGAALSYRMERDGPRHWLARRRQLSSLRLGRNHDQTMAAYLAAATDVDVMTDAPAENAARLLAMGAIGAIFSGRMEYGPRALGARSILASPADAAVNKTLNDRLDRTEFMPFAPYVAQEDADAVFDISDANRYACRFMTITCGVSSDWADKIPAVVHVDGTARPQVIDASENPLYAEILAAFKARTGLPVLVDTSFNAHEEPIVNRPEEALAALRAGRVDFLVTPDCIVRRKDPSSC